MLEEGDGWSITDYIAADIFAVVAGQPHPADPRTARETRKRQAHTRERMADIADFDRERRAAFERQQELG